MKILYLVAALVGGYFVYILVKKKNMVNIDTSKAKISKEQAGIYAAQLHTAMEDFGTDENIILDIFVKIDSEDFKLIYKEFGLRPYLWLGNAPAFMAMPIDLVEWLRKELSSGVTDNKIKDIVNGAGFVY